MRARNIKPGLFSDEDLVECSFAARILFMGLPCLADRMGRLEDRPKKIKMLLLPADNVDCDALLNELEQAGKIKRYEADGTRCIWIPGFLNHQEPHRNEKPSALPRHPEDQNPEEGPKAKAITSDQGQNKVGPRTDALALIPDSGFLIPDSERQTLTSSSSPETARGPAQAAQAEEAGACVSDFEPTAPELDAMPFEFQDLVSAYPALKVDLVPAFRAYDRLRKNPQFQIQAALADVAQRARSPAWTDSGGRFVPKLSKYLLEQRWRDPQASQAAEDPIVKQAKELSKKIEERERREGLRQ